MNKYQEAFETIAMIHGVDGLVSQFLDLKELVDEKLEQESRKDKLVVGSKWECQVNTLAPICNYADPILDNKAVAIGKSAIVTVLEIEKHYLRLSVKYLRTTKRFFLSPDQFLMCFKPKGMLEHE